MSTVTNSNTIRVYGTTENRNDIPVAPARLSKLFSVVANQYMTVPTEFVADVIMLLRNKQYAYKTKHFSEYTAFAIQYQKP